MDDKIPAALQSLLRQKLLDGVQQPLPRLTRRDTWIPRIPGKTLAVIGMRRSGKTSLLWRSWVSAWLLVRADSGVCRSPRCRHPSP